MERKRRLLQALNLISPEKSVLSVNELKTMLINDIESEDAEKAKAETEVVKEFTNIYLVKRDVCRLFGNTLTVYYLNGVKVGSYNTDWERLYECKGTKIMFSESHIIERDLEESMSETALRSCEEITEHEFRNYQKRYQKFVTLVYDILPKEDEI
jgi:hypothetical protein